VELIYFGIFQYWLFSLSSVIPELVRKGMFIHKNVLCSVLGELFSGAGGVWRGFVGNMKV
jgi:hypothetical protein